MHFSGAHLIPAPWAGEVGGTEREEAGISYMTTSCSEEAAELLHGSLRCNYCALRQSGEKSSDCAHSAAAARRPPAQGGEQELPKGKRLPGDGLKQVLHSSQPFCSAGPSALGNTTPTIINSVCGVLGLGLVWLFWFVWSFCFFNQVLIFLFLKKPHVLKGCPVML